MSLADPGFSLAHGQLPPNIPPPPPPMVSPVMKSDAAVADAYAIKTITLSTDFWVTFGLAFDSAALTYWNDTATYSPDLVELWKNGLGVFQYFGWDNTPEWYGISGGAGNTPPAVADTWQLIEVHYNGTQRDLYIDSTLVFNETYTAQTIDELHLGQVSSGYPYDPASVCYYRDVKVGTTQGDSDIFADDFSSGFLSNWSSTSGAVSVVTDPF